MSLSKGMWAYYFFFLHFSTLPNKNKTKIKKQNTENKPTNLDCNRSSQLPSKLPTSLLTLFSQASLKCCTYPWDSLTSLTNFTIYRLVNLHHASHLTSFLNLYNPHPVSNVHHFAIQYCYTVQIHHSNTRVSLI